jgi:hypothetical protein
MQQDILTISYSTNQYYRDEFYSVHKREEIKNFSKLL